MISYDCFSSRTIDEFAQFCLLFLVFLFVFFFFLVCSLSQTIVARAMEIIMDSLQKHMQTCFDVGAKKVPFKIKRSFHELNRIPYYQNTLKTNMGVLFIKY